MGVEQAEEWKIYLSLNIILEKRAISRKRLFALTRYLFCRAPTLHDEWAMAIMQLNSSEAS